MPAPSVIQICNMALGHLGNANTIQDLTERSVQARLCNLHYDQCRLEMLEGFDWHFARKRQALALHEEDAPDNGLWSYRYQVPASMVAARRIINPWGDQAPAIPYELELASDGSQSLLTNEEDAELLFTADVNNPAVFPPTFRLALSHLLASRITPAITGKAVIEDQQFKRYLEVSTSAASISANQGVAHDPRDSELITARY